MLVLIQVEDTNNILMATEELEVFTEDVAEVDLLMVVAIWLLAELLECTEGVVVHIMDTEEEAVMVLQMDNMDTRVRTSNMDQPISQAHQVIMITSQLRMALEQGLVMVIKEERWSENEAFTNYIWYHYFI